MSAKYIKRIDKEDGYFHIYNRGVSGKIIFNDEQDYEVFLDYLRDYLSPPAHPDTYKRNFTVKGRTFQGVPHRAKNYFNNINLIAYSLMSNHFHLLLQQVTKGSLENFMRSLCTRYSMYFNKKYQSSGSLFEGPYKSVYINSISPLLHLTHYLHHAPVANGIKLTDRHSSYAEYLGKRETLWVKPNVVLSFFNDSKNNAFKSIGDYKNFVEKYKPGQEDKKLLEGILLEKEYEHLAGSNPHPASISPPEETQPDPDLEPKSRFIEIAVATAMFVVLFSIGLKNVLSSSANNIISINTISPTPDTISPTATPLVAGVEDEKPKTTLTVKVSDGSTSINIRQNPTTQSEKIGEAKDNDIFEYVSIHSGWYGIKLADESIGYISSRYVEIVEETN